MNAGPILHLPARARSLPRNVNGRAAFLDRDGTLVRDTHYLTCAPQLELLPGAATAVTELGRTRHVFVVTNQSAIARGKLDPAGLREIHAALFRLLQAEGAELDAIYSCPHGDPADGATGCECRKPKPGMLQRAATDFALELSECVLFGDAQRDVDAAAAAGMRGIRIEKNAPNALLEAVQCLS